MSGPGRNVVAALRLPGRFLFWKREFVACLRHFGCSSSFAASGAGVDFDDSFASSTFAAGSGAGSTVGGVTPAGLFDFRLLEQL